MWFRFTNFVTSFLSLVFIVSLFNCGEIDVIRHRKGDKERRENYKLRQLLCHIPYQAITTTNRRFEFGSSTRYASVHFGNTEAPNDLRFPNLAFSVDKAQTWKYFTISEKLLASTIWDESAFYAVSSHNVYLSEDAGITWQKYPLPISNIQEVEVFQATGANQLVFIPQIPGENVKVFISLDRGRTWQSWELQGKHFIYFKSFQNNIYRILVSESSQLSNVKLYASYDFGQTWNLTYTFASGSTSDYSPSYLYFYNIFDRFASGGTSIFKTSDGGFTWTEYPQYYPFDYTAVFYASPFRVYSSKHYRRHGNGFPRFDGLFCNSTNNGQTWSELQINIYEVHEVYSPSEIVGTLSRTKGDAYIFSSFLSDGLKTNMPRFSYEKTTTLWDSHWAICWQNFIFTPTTGTRWRERGSNQ
ncbi:MAG: hypothetical protein N3A69_09435 [Leptospiraceae bacterium]|nr:hypothetical protein [Leptospiraceae bacterium]